jgi:hypothetical protein
MEIGFFVEHKDGKLGQYVWMRFVHAWWELVDIFEPEPIHITI